MPIGEKIRAEALAYVDVHIIDEAHIRTGFSFIQDTNLVDLIVLELRSARYIYRLMEMLDLKNTFSHPFCKFQIVQYAGVFEAAVDHLIFDRIYSNPALDKKVTDVRNELEKHETLVKIQGFSSKTKVAFDGDEAYLCTLSKGKKKNRINIKFDDRLGACLTLGLIDLKLHDEIIEFYKKRNSVHLSAKLKSAITVELSDTKRSFRRINAFCEYVKRGLVRQGELT